jgi:hypothetical protein
MTLFLSLNYEFNKKYSLYTANLNVYFLNTNNFLLKRVKK